MARQAAIQSRLKTRDVVRCERYRRPIHKRRRRTGAEPTKFAWREFMRAHLSWYQSNSAYRGYQEIWKHVGSIDWAALPHEHRNWYALLAVKGGQLPDETAPPRAVNNFALPSLLIHEPQNSDWRWDDPGDFAQRTNPTGLRVLHEVPSDRFPLFVEPIDGTSEGSLLTPVRMAWKRVRHLGKGALGSVDLWIKYDLLTFEIYDRVALKTTSFNESPEKRAHWADPDRWTDYPHVPAEVAAIRTLNKEPRCPYISQYRGFRVFARHRAYRILTPVAEFGNLESLLKGWAVEVGENGLERRKDDAETLPASFVFDIFAALVIGAQHMIASNILHNDIKLENILLFDDTEERCMREFALPGPDEGSENASAEDEDEQDEEDEDEEEEEEVEAEGWGAKPVFTDFGLCTPMTSTRLFRNPDRLRWRGTPVYRPPEQLTHPVEPSLSIIQGQDEREPISEKASVFSIGVSIFHILHAHSFLQRRPFNWDDQHRWAPDLYNYWQSNPQSADALKGYIKHQFDTRTDLLMLEYGADNASYQTLQDLVTWCLDFRPSNRPTLQELLNELTTARPQEDQLSELISKELMNSAISDFAFGESQQTLAQNKINIKTAEQTMADQKRESEDRRRAREQQRAAEAQQHMLQPAEAGTIHLEPAVQDDNLGGNVDPATVEICLDA